MRITSQLIRSRARGPLHSVEYLDLSGLDIVAIERIGPCHKLQTLILRENNIDAVENLSGCHQLWKLDLSNNRVMYSFLTDRIHVIDCLPNVWILDGRLITTAERIQVEHFFQDSALTDHPVRHKFSKEQFIPSSMKKIEVNGIFGAKIVQLAGMHLFPSEAFTFLIIYLRYVPCIELFLLNRQERCLISSLLLSAVKVDRDEKEDGGLYDRLYLCLYYTVSELNKRQQRELQHLKKTSVNPIITIQKLDVGDMDDDMPNPPSTPTHHGSAQSLAALDEDSNKNDETPRPVSIVLRDKLDLKLTLTEDMLKSSALIKENRNPLHNDVEKLLVQNRIVNNVTHDDNDALSIEHIDNALYDCLKDAMETVRINSARKDDHSKMENVKPHRDFSNYMKSQRTSQSNFIKTPTMMVESLDTCADQGTDVKSKIAAEDDEIRSESSLKERRSRPPSSRPLRFV
uniref:Uncharacterized protein LOC102803312 n=1 Tax=Saccoglossus kowalevskii TaxID=10224 RepID=A0ABM0MQL7_SACKO|nr:PREDICTED: uncharacterized protein LOC102803312 [Saccoglossus kowalevskii]